MTFYYRNFLTTDPSSSGVNLRQFLWELCPLELRILEIHSFPHDSLTFFDILSWNFAYDFVYCTTDQVRVSLICVNFYGSYAPFGTYITGNTVFRTFLLHDLTYWADISHMTLLYCTTDQVRMSVNLRQFLWELCPFWNLECWKYTVFRTFLLHALTYWAEIFYMTLFNVLQIKSECCHLCPSIFCTFLLYTCIDKFSWNLKVDVGFFNEFLLEKY